MSERSYIVLPPCHTRRNPLVASVRAARSRRSDEYYQNFVAPYNQPGGPDILAYPYRDPKCPEEIEMIKREAIKRRGLDSDMENWHIVNRPLNCL